MTGIARWLNHTQEFSLVEIDLGQIPVEKAVLFGLMQLYEDSFIALSSSPLTWVDSACVERFHQTLNSHGPPLVLRNPPSIKEFHARVTTEGHACVEIPRA